MSEEFTVDEVLEQRRQDNVERNGNKRSRKIFFGLTLFVAFSLPLIPVMTGSNRNYILHILLYIFMYIAMASSWNILGGYTGYVSLGHNVFFAIGGYTSGVLLAYLGWSSFVTWPIAGLAALAFGLLFGFITLRIKGPTFLISTIALMLIVRIAIDNWEFVGGSNGMSVPMLDLDVIYSKIPYYYALLLTAVAAIFASYRIKNSKFGLGLRAISQDEVKAESAGVPTSLYKVLAFAISGLFVGIAGAFWGQYLTYLRPSIFLIIPISANLVLMSILGGKGTVVGPVIGATLIILLNEFFVSQFGGTELNIAGTGLLMLLILLYFPNGIIGSLRKRKKLPSFIDWE